MTEQTEPDRAITDPALTIDGETVAGDDRPYAVRDPGRPDDVVCIAPTSSPGQVDRAVASAAAAQPAWAASSFEERAELVVAAARAATGSAQAAGLAGLLTRENGKLFGDAEFEVATFAAVAEVFADLAAAALEPRHGPGGGRVLARPHGVVASLIPFNWPVSVVISKAAPALLAGNTVVVKPPPTCPGAALSMAASMAAALPQGVLATVNGPGPAVGGALVAHRDVSMVSLTGGTATGRAVAHGAADRLVPTVLELGGNDAAIVTPDVEVTGTLARALLDSAFTSSGQVCMALKRLYVPESKVDVFIDALVACAADQVTGHGLNPDTTIGPVHTAAAAARAEAVITEAESSGAVVHRPGRAAIGDAEAGGNYVRPAIVSSPSRDARIVAEEQFAPILPVLGYRDLDDAIAAANATSFGLAASVWSGDDALAEAVAERLEAGTVFINAHGPGALDPAQPFGGWKQSGIGVEYGPDGVTAYTRPQAFPASHRLP